MLFSSRLSWTPAKHQLVKKGKKAMYQIEVVIKKLGGLSIKEAFLSCLIRQLCLLSVMVPKSGDMNILWI